MKTETWWTEETVRSQYAKSVEVSERCLAKFGRKHPMRADGQSSFDQSLALHDVRKHLVAVDCFSSRESLVSELRRILLKPVAPSAIAPFCVDRYYAIQKKDIKETIQNLTPTSKAFSSNQGSWK